MSNNIGPSLPPHLQEKKESEERNIGPALPPWLQNRSQGEDSCKHENLTSDDSIGPTLPPILKNYEDVEKDGGDVDVVAAAGPALPPWMRKGKISEANDDNEDSFGPSLPPGYRKPILGPQLPGNIASNEDSDDDEPVIGPLPPSANDDHVLSVAEQFEQRSKKMKDKLEGREQPKKLEREEWMTELPPLLQGFASGPRKFRAKEKNEIGDRSVWTETPSDRAKKAAQGIIPKTISDEERINREAWAKRDAEIAKKLSDQPASERSESLMNMHEKARKRKLKEDQESGEANIRRPFDREVDLQTNRFDDAAKKRFIKKTQGLSSRFSTGSTSSKFL